MVGTRGLEAHGLGAHRPSFKAWACRSGDAKLGQVATAQAEVTEAVLPAGWSCSSRAVRGLELHRLEY